MTGYPAVFVDRHAHYPRYVGACTHCGCVFPVEDAGGLEDNGGGVIPLARCPQCRGYVGMTDRHKPADRPTA